MRRRVAGPELCCAGLPKAKHGPARECTCAGGWQAPSFAAHDRLGRLTSVPSCIEHLMLIASTSGFFSTSAMWAAHT